MAGVLPPILTERSSGHLSQVRDHARWMRSFYRRRGRSTVDEGPQSLSQLLTSYLCLTP